MYSYRNDLELYHHGIKGQKWGVRRYQKKDGSLTDQGKKRYSDDITTVSKRKLKKQISKINKTPENNKNTIRTNNKVQSELNKTKEGKDYNNAVKALKEMDDYVKKTKGPKAQLVLDRKTAEEFMSYQNAYNKKGDELVKKYRDEFASSTIKDLGYKDTAEGREYLKKIGLV